MCIRDRGGEGGAWGSEWTAGEGITFTVATNTAKEYRVRQTDSNNNTSSPSVGLLVTHDDLQPTITTFSVAGQAKANRARATVWRGVDQRV